MLLRIILFLSTFNAAIVPVWWNGGFLAGLFVSLGVWFGTFVLLVLAAVAFLAICCALVNYNKPQEEDSSFYRKLAAVYIEALIRLLSIRVHTEGLEKTPKEGRFLLVCNHQFEADPGILLHYFKDSQLAFISKQENRRLPFVGKIMHKLLCQLLDREDDRQALRVILKCIDILKADKASIAVFPEGGIKIKGKLSAFRPGVFKIAAKAKVPIVVCTLRNTQYVLKNGLRLKPTDVHLHLVDVIEPERYAGMKTTELSDLVHKLMAEDLGPEFWLEETE